MTSCSTSPRFFRRAFVVLVTVALQVVTLERKVVKKKFGPHLPPAFDGTRPGIDSGMLDLCLPTRPAWPSNLRQSSFATFPTAWPALKFSLDSISKCNAARLWYCSGAAVRAKPQL